MSKVKRTLRHPIKAWLNRAESIQRRMDTVEAFARALDECVKEDYEERLSLEQEVSALTLRVESMDQASEVAELENRVRDLEVDYEA